MGGAWIANDMNSEKHAKKEEALAQLKAGVKFDQVARDFSEDKAKQGKFLGSGVGVG